jgi:hypothetical protein
MAHCGACTVHLDGQAIRSCVLQLSAVAGRRLPPSRGCRARLPKQCKRPGSRSRYRNVATANPARSCPQPHSSKRTDRPQMPTSTAPGIAPAAVASKDFTVAPNCDGRSRSATSMPGITTSRVNCAVPSTLAATSTRGGRRPMSLKLPHAAESLFCLEQPPEVCGSRASRVARVQYHRRPRQRRWGLE